MKRLIILWWVCAFVGMLSVNAQDLVYYKQIIKELSSARYQGRGYARDGANMAGKYLEKEFQYYLFDKSQPELNMLLQNFQLSHILLL